MGRSNSKSSNLKTKSIPAIKKRSSPTKASKAAANTRPLSFYFSPTQSSTSESDTISSRSSKMVDARHRLASLSQNIVDHNKTGTERNSNTPLSPKRSVDASPTTTPTNKQPQPKKRKTQALFTPPVLMEKGRSLGLANVREKTTTKCNGTNDQKMQESENKHPSHTPPTAGSGSTLNTTAESGIHIREQLTNHKSEARVNNTCSATEVRLGLVRVEKAVASLQDVCLTISDPSCNETRKVFPISNGVFLGRNDANSQAKPNKVLLDIPNKELGVSRKQVYVKSINAPQDKGAEPGMINDKSRSGRLSIFLHKKQLSCPSVEIMCAKNAVNPIQIVESRAMNQRTIQPDKTVLNRSYYLLKGQSCSLKVGDAIEFDAYNRRSSGAADSRKIDTSTPIPSDVKFVFRVVAIESPISDVDENVEKQSTVEVPKIINRSTVNDLTADMAIEMMSEKAASTPTAVKPRKKDSVRPKSVRISKQKEVAEESTEKGPRTRRCKKAMNETTHQTKKATLKSIRKKKSSHKSLVPPRVGDLFATQWSGYDLFLKKKIRKPFIGTAVEVKAGTNSGDFQVTLEYGDKSKSRFKFPCKDLHRILPGNGKASSIYHTEDSGTFAFDTNPSFLVAGDLVECQSQDGIEENKWLAGRVAAVDDDDKYIDIAYFDGKGFEERIPFPNRKIRLVERGSSQASKWLIGVILSTPAEAGSTKTKKKITGIFSVEENVGDSPLGSDCSEKLFCVIKGKHDNQQVPYKDALELLFSEHRAHCKEQKQLLRWPDDDSGSSTDLASSHGNELKAVSSDCGNDKKSNEKLREEVVGYPKAPKAGDLVRVLYKQQGMFSAVTEELWAMAEVLNVRKASKSKVPGYLLSIKYSDNQEEEVEYPDQDVEIITRAAGSNSFVYETVDGSFACDKNPSSLMVGDYVECLHQDGKFKGRWYAGRVASTSLCGEKIDVAYFDGEFEKSIPTGKGVISLICRGLQDANVWLVGAEFAENITLGRGRKRKSKVVRVHMGRRNETNEPLPFGVNDTDDLFCTVKRPNGSEVDIPYNDVLKALFSLKEKNTPSVTFWPNSDVSTSPSIASDRIEGSYVALGGSLHNPFICSNEDLLDDDDVNMSQDSFYGLSFCHVKVAGPQNTNLNSALAKTCWRAFESTQPFDAYGMLVHMDTSWNISPNTQLATNMSVFLEKGPQSEDIQIQEPFRTELVTRYMNRVMLKTNEIDPQIRHQICPPDFAQLESLLSLPLNVDDKIHVEDMSPPQIRRLAQSLHHSAKSLGRVGNSLANELSDVIGENDEVQTHDLNGLPFTSLFWNNDPLNGNGIRSSLKTTVQKATRCLLMHGHWLVGHPNQAHLSSPMGSDQQQCAVESKACIKALCQIVCYISWLYCAKEEIAFAHNDCCFLIRDAYNAELASFDYSSLVTNGRKINAQAKNSYRKQITVQFVLLLETTFSKNLLMRLSDLLKVSKEILLILG